MWGPDHLAEEGIGERSDWVLEPTTNQVTKSRIMQKRFYLVEKAKDAELIGIVVQVGLGKNII